MTIPIWVLVVALLHLFSCVFLAFSFGIKFDVDNIKFTNEYELKDKATGNVVTYEKKRWGLIGLMFWLFIIIMTWEAHFILIIASLIASDLAEKISLNRLSIFLENIAQRVLYPIYVIY